MCGKEEGTLSLSKVKEEKTKKKKREKEKCEQTTREMRRAKWKSFLDHELLLLFVKIKMGINFAFFF